MKRTTLLLLCTIAAFLPHQRRAWAQFVPPDGEYVITKDIYDVGFHIPTQRVVATQHQIYWAEFLKDSVKWGEDHPVWTAPEGRTLEAARFKWEKRDLSSATYRVRYYVLLDNGELLMLKVSGSARKWEVERVATVPENESVTFEDVLGDALYVRTSSNTVVSHDSGSTWAVDDAGLGGAAIHDLSIDTSQYCYAATSAGLFKQHPDSSVWHLNTSLGLMGLSSVFVDRRNRIFVSSSANGVYVSTDEGQTWALDTTGLGKAGGKFGDDAFGNIYVIPGTHLFRSRGGTQPWERIDGGILSQTATPPTIRDVGGDTLLDAATSFGMYTSTDQGTTWTESNSGIQAENITSLIKVQTGRTLVSTSLAIFSKEPLDTSWTKRYPQTGYAGPLPLYNDGRGNLYFLGSSFKSNGASSVYTSSDNGVTWGLQDTAGISQMNVGIFAVDETGTEHLATTQYGGSFFASLFVRAPGGTWIPDMAGFQSTNYSYSSSMTSDRRGNAFLSGSYQDQSSGKELNARVMRRPIGGGTWVPDTVGLDPSIHYFNSMIPGKNGEVYGAVGHNLFRRATNGVWSRISLPSASGFSSITCLAVDSSGALFTGFFGGAGVYFTTNNGSAWTLAGASGVTPSSLVSYGDTTYALTSGHGVIVLTRTTTSVPPSAGVTMPGSYALYQNYPDPFNPSTRIEYRVSQRSLVSLRVYNVLGQEVTTLVNETKDPGTYSVAWDAKSRSSGAYFYRLVAGSFVDTKKMVLMR